MMELPIRTATIADIPAIAELVQRSVRGLGQVHYRQEQLEGALAGAFGVDSQLIRDSTYFVIAAGDRIIASGGWSCRRTLFGGDAGSGRDAGLLDPATDAAKIRAFYVDPDYARQGLGRRLLEHCEAMAIARGFSRFELMATLPGIPLYEAGGYVRGELVRHPVAAGVTIEFVPMYKHTNPS